MVLLVRMQHLLQHPPQLFSLDAVLEYGNQSLFRGAFLALCRAEQRAEQRLVLSKIRREVYLRRLG